MEITSLYESADAKFGAVGPLLLARYRATTLASLDAWDVAEAQLLTQHEKISTLTVIGQMEGLLKVDEAVRTRSAELGKKYDGKVLGSAIVVSATGLSAVMVRTFLSGFFLLSRAETPMKTFKTLPEGFTWLQGLPGQSLSLKLDVNVAGLERFFA